MGVCVSEGFWESQPDKKDTRAALATQVVVAGHLEARGIPTSLRRAAERFAEEESAARLTRGMVLVGRRCVGGGAWGWGGGGVVSGCLVWGGLCSMRTFCDKGSCLRDKVVIGWQKGQNSAFLFDVGFHLAMCEN